MKIAVILGIVASVMALDTGFGPTFTFEKGADKTELKIVAKVPAKTYLILALGTPGQTVDMLYFGGKASNNYMDMQGKKGSVPQED